MKTILLAALAFCFGTTAMSQTFHLYTRGVDYLLPASAMGEMTLCGTDSLQVLGQNFALSDIDSLTVDQATYTPRLVDVIYAGDRAQITADAALIPYLTITHKGAKVDIRQSDDVSDLTCGEITYRLSGVAADGGFAVTPHLLVFCPCPFCPTFHRRPVSSAFPRGATRPVCFSLLP